MWFIAVCETWTSENKIIINKITWLSEPKGHTTT